MTLIFWQFIPLSLSDVHENQPAKQESVLPPASEKPLITDNRHYQGILITKQQLTGMLTEQFTKYGIEDQIPIAKAVIACESSWNVNAHNKDISYGIAEFTPATWKDFGHGDIMNPLSQLDVMAKMWSKGLQHRWDCYNMIK